MHGRGIRRRMAVVQTAARAQQRPRAGVRPEIPGPRRVRTQRRKRRRRRGRNRSVHETVEIRIADEALAEEDRVRQTVGDIGEADRVPGGQGRIAEHPVVGRTEARVALRPRVTTVGGDASRRRTEADRVIIDSGRRADERPDGRGRDGTVAAEVQVDVECIPAVRDVALFDLRQQFDEQVCPTAVRPRLGDARRQPAVDVVVVVRREAELFEVVLAPDARRRFADLLHRREQQADENRDDGDDHEQFDQRERATDGEHANLIAISRPFSVPIRPSACFWRI